MNILKIHMMKPGHRSEDDSAGYVCSNAILGHLKRGGEKKKKRKFMPFLQKNPCINASV